MSRTYGLLKDMLGDSKSVKDELVKLDPKLAFAWSREVPSFSGAITPWMGFLDMMQNDKADLMVSVANAEKARVFHDSALIQQANGNTTLNPALAKAFMYSYQMVMRLSTGGQPMTDNNGMRFIYEQWQLSVRFTKFGLVMGVDTGLVRILHLRIGNMSGGCEEAVLLLMQNSLLEDKAPSMLDQIRLDSAKHCGRVGSLSDRNPTLDYALPPEQVKTTPINQPG